MRKAVIKKEDIILESIHQIYLNGLENFTPKKAAIACDISEGSVYHYFSNKQELLQECMLYILSETDKALREVPLGTQDSRSDFFTIWNEYFRYYFTHKEQAYFHQIYRNSSMFQVNKKADLLGCFPYLNEQIEQFHLEEKIAPELFWTFVIDNILNYVLRVTEGIIEDTPENAKRYFELMIGGIHGLFPEK